MQKNILTFCFVLLLQYCSAQGTQIAMLQYLGGSLSDMGQFIQPSNDGNLLIVGTVNSSDGSITGQHGGRDIWVAKVTPQGAIIWQRTLGGSEDDVAVAYTYDTGTGTITVVANTFSANGDVTVSRGLGDVWVFRLNASNVLDWQRTLGGSSAEKALKIISTSDAGYLVCAETYSNNNDVTGNHGGADIWLVKLNGSNGAVAWKRCYGGTGNEFGDYSSTTLTETVAGQYIFTANAASANGDVAGFNGGPSDAWVVAVNSSNGGINWQQCIGGSGIDVVRKMKQQPNGNWILLAQTASAALPGYHAGAGGAANNFDILRCKLSGNGTLLSQRCYGSVFNEAPADIVVLNDSTDLLLATVHNKGGNVITTFNADEFSRDLWLCKLRNDTTLLWQKTLGGSKDEQYGEWVASDVVSSGDIQLMPNNAVLLMGISRSADGNVQRNHGYGTFFDYDLWIVAVDSAGVITSQTTVGGSGNEWVGAPLISAGPGSYYFTGSTQSINNRQPAIGNFSDIIVGRINGNNYLIGKVFFDADSNGVQNVGEPLVNGGYITIAKTGFAQNAAVHQGTYSMPMDTGIYQLNCVPPSAYFKVPPIRMDTMVNYFETDTINFPLQRAVTARDLLVTAVPLTQLRPDSATAYSVVYGNNGTDTARNGLVVFKKEARMNLLQATPVADSISGDSLMWKYTNLLPQQFLHIDLVLKANPSPSIAPWDTLYQTAGITPTAGDSNPVNNTDTIYQVADTGVIVRIKTENHGRSFSLQQAAAGSYLHYTINYKNTLGVTIDSLLITDTLDVLLDSLSFISFYATHPHQLKVGGSRNISWAFNAINLLPGQTCTVSFRVKANSTVASGSTIKNKAYVWRKGIIPVATSAEVQTTIE